MAMYIQLLRRRHLSKGHIGFSLVMCCLVLWLSGCTSPFVGTSSSMTPSPTLSQPTPSPTSHPARPKVDPIGTEALARARLARVQQIIASMSLDQKLGQLIIVEYIGNNYQNSGLQYMVSQQFVGGFMYQASNGNFDAPYNVVSQVAALSHQANGDAHIPLLIPTDQEGGLVNRLLTFHGYLPSAQDIAATGDPRVALEQGTLAAKWMLELGINADLAPVVDVQTVDPPILETRMFGRDPQTVALFAGAFLAGLQNNGVAGCLKHFPGLGAISSDPHFGLPTVDRSKANLDAIDLAPYKAMIAANHPAMIMATDVLMPAIDSTLPAELSPKTIDGVLRGELGYNGVVITDGLYMHGISDTWTLSQAAVLSILAGNDLIEGPYTVNQVAEVMTALKQAIEQGRLTMDRIDQSLTRILLMKMQYGIIQ